LIIEIVEPETTAAIELAFSDTHLTIVEFANAVLLSFSNALNYKL